MRPKPTREWVMLELERLGVRVVSGRLKSGGPGGESGGVGVGDDDSADSVGGGGDTKGVNNNNNMSGVSFSIWFVFQCYIKVHILCSKFCTP